MTFCSTADPSLLVGNTSQCLLPAPRVQPLPGLGPVLRALILLPGLEAPGPAIPVQPICPHSRVSPSPFSPRSANTSSSLPPPGPHVCPLPGLLAPTPSGAQRGFCFNVISSECLSECLSDPPFFSSFPSFFHCFFTLGRLSSFSLPPSPLPSLPTSPPRLAIRGTRPSFRVRTSMLMEARPPPSATRPSLRTDKPARPVFIKGSSLCEESSPSVWTTVTFHDPQSLCPPQILGSGPQRRGDLPETSDAPNEVKDIHVSSPLHATPPPTKHTHLSPQPHAPLCTVFSL